MSDGAVELLQLRANELLAAAAIYGDGLVLEVRGSSPPVPNLRFMPPTHRRRRRRPRPRRLQDVHPAELLVAAEEGAFDAATHSHLAAVDTRLALALRPDAGAACTARLHLRMPHRYPEAPLEVEAVSSATCGRQWEADCQRRLQGLATAAAGRECLHELLAVLLDTLQPAGGGSSEQPGGAPAAAAGQQPAALQSLGEQEQEQEQVLLLRLDHMRDRPGYSRTLRRWARELGLAGRLLFCGGGRCSRGLILVLLEGPAGGAREFQKRLRTCNVDVDSAGR